MPIGRPLASEKRHIVGRSKCRPGSAVKINLSRLMHYSQVLCITVQVKTMPFVYYYTRHEVDASILILQLTHVSLSLDSSPPGEPPLGPGHSAFDACNLIYLSANA